MVVTEEELLNVVRFRECGQHFWTDGLWEMRKEKSWGTPRAAAGATGWTGIPLLKVRTGDLS